MCFLRKFEPIKIADSDITCYKVVTPSFSSPLTYVSLYRGFKYEVNKLYEKSVIFKTECKGVYATGFGSAGFHSYIYLSSESLYNDLIQDRACLIECVIPKGSLYIQGIDSCSSPSYLSDKIIIKKEISFQDFINYKNDY